MEAALDLVVCRQLLTRVNQMVPQASSASSVLVFVVPAFAGTFFRLQSPFISYKLDAQAHI